MHKMSVSACTDRFNDGDKGRKSLQLLLLLLLLCTTLIGTTAAAAAAHS